jgi:hypothetical protein
MLSLSLSNLSCADDGRGENAGSVGRRIADRRRRADAAGTDSSSAGPVAWRYCLSQQEHHVLFPVGDFYTCERRAVCRALFDWEISALNCWVEIPTQAELGRGNLGSRQDYCCGTLPLDVFY